MKRAKLVKIKEIVLEDIKKPYPGSSEVLIRVKYCGICGSDLHAYYGKHPFIQPPIVLGHEFSGVISEIVNAEGLKVGQKVVVLPLITCGKCYYCKTGQYNRCDKVRVIGCQTDGAFSEYIVVPSNRVLPLPTDFPLKAGALVEPLAVAVHAIRRAAVKKRHNVIVLGDGPIGILTALVAKTITKSVVIAGVSDYKLSVAINCGIDFVVNTKRAGLVKYACENFGSQGTDIIFDCVGFTAETINQAIQIARRGGRIVIVGIFERDVPVLMSHLQDRELGLLGSSTYTFSDFQDAIYMISSKKINPVKIVTKIFPLTKITEAFQFLAENRDKTLKVLVNASK